MTVFLRVLAAVGIFAANTPIVHAASPGQQSAVVNEIAKRSGLPSQTVEHLLGDCAANQQSIDFCAWRDQIEAEQALSDAASKAKALSSHCDGLVTAQLAAWEKRRDTRCAAEAEKSDGGGSNEPAAEAECAASMTADYTRHFKPPSECK